MKRRRIFVLAIFMAALAMPAAAHRFGVQITDDVRLPPGGSLTVYLPDGETAETVDEETCRALLDDEEERDICFATYGRFGEVGEKPAEGTVGAVEVRDKDGDVTQRFAGTFNAAGNLTGLRRLPIITKLSATLGSDPDSTAVEHPAGSIYQSRQPGHAQRYTFANGKPVSGAAGPPLDCEPCKPATATRPERSTFPGGEPIPVTVSEHWTLTEEEYEKYKAEGPTYLGLPEDAEGIVDIEAEDPNNPGTRVHRLSYWPGGSPAQSVDAEHSFPLMGLTQGRQFEVVIPPEMVEALGGSLHPLLLRPDGSALTTVPMFKQALPPGLGIKTGWNFATEGGAAPAALDPDANRPGPVPHENMTTGPEDRPFDVNLSDLKVELYPDGWDSTEHLICDREGDSGFVWRAADEGNVIVRGAERVSSYLIWDPNNPRKKYIHPLFAGPYSYETPSDEAEAGRIAAMWEKGEVDFSKWDARFVPPLYQRWATMYCGATESYMPGWVPVGPFYQTRNTAPAHVQEKAMRLQARDVGEVPILPVPQGEEKCRYSLDESWFSRLAASVRQPAPPVITFVTDPEAGDTWNTGDDGALPVLITNVDEARINAAVRASLQTSKTVEIVLADGDCNQSKLTVSIQYYERYVAEHLGKDGERFRNEVRFPSPIGLHEDELAERSDLSGVDFLYLAVNDFRAGRDESASGITLTGDPFTEFLMVRETVNPDGSYSWAPVTENAGTGLGGDVDGQSVSSDLYGQIDADGTFIPALESASGPDQASAGSGSTGLQPPAFITDENGNVVFVLP